MATQMIGRMAVEVEGEGFPVILLHGLGGTSNTWASLIPTLARFKTIRIDLPGAGRSHKVEGPISIASLVSAVERIALSLSVSNAHIIGHSMGTIIATHLAASTKLAKTLLLFGPLLAPPDGARAAIKLRATRARSEGVEGMQAIADLLVNSSTSTESRSRRLTSIAFVRESLMRQCPDGYARNCDALAEANSADTSRILCPTLLVTGSDDAVAPPQAVRSMSEKIAGSSVEILRGCGHWTTIEMPDECAAITKRFYERSHHMNYPHQSTRSAHV
jgi:3-oxoadipate enol-lactonase